MHIQSKRPFVTMTCSAIIALTLFVGLCAHAKPNLQPIAVEKIDLATFVKSGAITGGTAKSENVGPLSLLQVQKVAAAKDSAKNFERLVIKFGDKNGVALTEPGFFHIAIDEGGTRLVLDLAQVQQTSVDQNDLRAMFKQSPLIRDVEITMDPVDQSTNMTFRMKCPVMAKASGKGNLTIDIQEAN